MAIFTELIEGLKRSQEKLEVMKGEHPNEDRVERFVELDTQVVFIGLWQLANQVASPDDLKLVDGMNTSWNQPQNNLSQSAVDRVENDLNKKIINGKIKVA